MFSTILYVNQRPAFPPFLRPVFTKLKINCYMIGQMNESDRLATEDTNYINLEVFVSLIRIFWLLDQKDGLTLKIICHYICLSNGS